MPKIMENLQLGCAVCKIGIYSLCCRLCCRRKERPPRPEFTVICIGLDKAGKTTLLTLMCGENAEGVEPTSGFSIKPIQFPDCIVNVKEIGGNEKVRPFWQHYFGSAEGVVFVVDSSSDEVAMETACEELHKATQNPQLKGLPLLVLANCQDKPQARDSNQVHSMLELDNIVGRKVILKVVSQQLSAEEIASTFTEFNKVLIGQNTISGSDAQNRV